MDQALSYKTTAWAIRARLRGLELPPRNQNPWCKPGSGAEPIRRCIWCPRRCSPPPAAGSAIPAPCWLSGGPCGSAKTFRSAIPMGAGRQSDRTIRLESNDEIKKRGGRILGAPSAIPNTRPAVRYQQKDPRQCRGAVTAPIDQPAGRRVLNQFPAKRSTGLW